MPNTTSSLTPDNLRRAIPWSCVFYWLQLYIFTLACNGLSESTFAVLARFPGAGLTCILEVVREGRFLSASPAASHWFRQSPAQITLLLPQCDYRLDLHCASRWEIAGCGGDRGQQQRNSDERQRIGGGNAEQET